MVGKKRTKNTVILMGLLLEFAFALLGGALLGYTLDEWLETKPWLTVICVIIATLTSVKILATILTKAKKNMEDEGP